MNDPLVARASDPETSTAGVKRTRTIKSYVLAACCQLGWRFTDTQITELVELLTGKRQQRNSIARTRLTLERDGLIKRHEKSMWKDNEMTFTVTEQGHIAARRGGSR